MRQVWFVTLAYYIFTILILFLDEYRLTLGFMLRVKHYLIVKKKLRQALMAAGLVLCLLNLLLPAYPGPVILGDLFPSVVCFFIALYFFRFADSDRKTYLKLSDRTCAIMLTVFSAVHFLCPWLILF